MGDPLENALAESLFLSSQGWSEWPTLDEIRAGVTRAMQEPEAVKLLAELKRHRDANLVRAVLNGADPEWISEYIASEEFDRIPWRVAEKIIARGSV